MAENNNPQHTTTETRPHIDTFPRAAERYESRERERRERDGRQAG
jgi:hypothetical protein